MTFKDDYILKMENLKVLAEEYNLEILDDKLSYIETLEAAKGKVEGYYVSILLDLRSYIVKINIDSEVDRNKVTDFMERLSGEIKDIRAAECRKNYIYMLLKDSGSRELTENIQKSIDRTIEFLKKENVKSSCAFCGDGESEIKATSVIKNEAEIDFICEKCHEDRVREMSENKERMKKIKENYFLGFIGALLGASIGGILWIVIGMLGFVASISVIAIIIGSLAGYTMLAKKMSLLGTFLYVIAAGTVMAGSHFIEVAFELKKSYKEQGVEIGFIESIKELADYTLNNSEIARDVWMDPYFIIAFVVILGAGFFIARITSRDSKGIYSIRRD